MMIRGINKLPIFDTKVEKEKIIQYIIEAKEELKVVNKVKKEVINQLIIKTDLTAKEISELTDMPRSTVAKIKTEIRNAKAKNILGTVPKI